MTITENTKVVIGIGKILVLSAVLIRLTVAVLEWKDQYKDQIAATNQTVKDIKASQITAADLLTWHKKTVRQSVSLCFEMKLSCPKYATRGDQNVICENIMPAQLQLQLQEFQ